MPDPRCPDALVLFLEYECHKHPAPRPHSLCPQRPSFSPPGICARAHHGWKPSVQTLSASAIPRKRTPRRRSRRKSRSVSTLGTKIPFIEPLHGALLDVSSCVHSVSSYLARFAQYAPSQSRHRRPSSPRPRYGGRRPRGGCVGAGCSEGIADETGKPRMGVIEVSAAAVCPEEWDLRCVGKLQAIYLKAGVD